MTSTEDHLAQSGVKGMKWGVRKTRQPAPKSSSDHKKVAKHKGKPAHTLTNKQLKDLNTRIELETKYNKMNPSRLSRGQKQVAAVLAVGATANEVIRFSRSPAGRHIQALFHRATAAPTVVEF